MIRSIVARVLIGILAALSAGAAVAQTQQYDGAARIGNLDVVTVVYPAAPDPIGRVHRNSAVLRASYLTERYGVQTSVVADTEITEKQLRGHLLLLGWDNRLLGTEEAPYPWKRDASGMSFLGVGGNLYTDDLLFLRHSPYNEKRYLAFWSRIDPELDRFLSFPFVGSDWAIYRDYFILHQGMFVEVPGWPPPRNELAEHSSTFRLPPRVEKRGHYVLHYDEALIKDAEIAGIAAAREQALERAAAMLGHPVPQDFEVLLYLYDDVEHKHDRTGVADPVHSLALRRELHMPARHAAVPNPHEEIHLLAGRFYGTCTLTAVYEGLALMLENRDTPEKMAAWAALIEEHEARPSLEQLVDDEKLRRLSASGLAFPAAALLIDWLESRKGEEARREIYSMMHIDAEETLARIAGVDSGAKVDDAFGTFVARRATSGQDELEYRRILAEANERARVGDFAGVVEALGRALEKRPGDALLAYRIAVARIENGDYDAARPELRGLMQPGRESDPAWLPVYCQYQLARIEDLQGNRDAAVAAYRQVLGMPDERDAHARAREALSLLGAEPSE